MANKTKQNKQSFRYSDKSGYGFPKTIHDILQGTHASEEIVSDKY